ncbi:hypothetical protein LTR66_000527 [Elasticomyces elasticus]|nr:hypothetical protein LTR28_002257 [Elasticomyces elasticus]KAK5000680.1 hypothetical protein LTR66_000527 [Elasticomyces elasticus]
MSSRGLWQNGLAFSSYTGSAVDDPRHVISPSRRPSPVSEAPGTAPTLSHRIKHDKSILAVVLSDDYIFAGTEGGEILVYGLTTYEQVKIIEGHKGSVLGLCLSQDQRLLFSSAGDRITNVWNTSDFRRAYCLYSTYDIGDVFCVSHSPSLNTVYLGAQNTTIQWYDLNEKDRRPRPRPGDHPQFREDPFFDSSGPGGIRTPRPADAETQSRDAVGGQVLEIDKDNIQHYAHFGYVYCMLLATGVIPDTNGSEALISGGGDGVINIWTLDGKRGGAIDHLYKLDDDREEGHSILSIALDGTFLYSGRTGGEINVWDLETRQLVRSLKAHRDDVLSITIGGGFTFSAAVTGFVRKFNRQYECKARIRAHEGRILASAYTVHKRRPIYVSGGSDNTLAIWDVSDSSMAPVVNNRTSNEVLLESLKGFIAYRTVSTDPKYSGDCRRGASHLRSVFKGFGAVTHMLTTNGPYNPVIYARFRGNPATAAKRKKILFYGHYDVVAAEDEQGKWLTDPFTMEGINGYLYGRGTSDNKGPIMAAIFACAELMAEQALGSDIVFLIEGEEECGSRGFAELVRKHKEIIGHVDWILLANSYWLDDRIPCLTYGLRGVIHVTVQIESKHSDLHSGVDGSSQLDESLKDLVLVLATLTGPHGRVELPGFYEAIPDISEEEERLYADITRSLVRRNPGLGDAKTLASTFMHRWREASLTIHRFQTSGPDNATIIPRMAKAALSIRLVPNQEASKVGETLVNFLHAEFNKLGSSNKLTVTIDHQAEPWLGDFNNQIFQTLEEAIMDVWSPSGQTRRQSSSAGILKPSFPNDNRRHEKDYFTALSPTTSTVLANGSAATPLMTPSLDSTADSALNRSEAEHRRKPLYIREGGSIPAIRFLEKEFDAPAAHFPCGQASDSAHLDNERLRLLNLYKSKDVFKKVFRDLPQK